MKPPVDLSDIVERIQQMREVRKVDLEFGDLVIINTMNSIYSIYVLNTGCYIVSGGWFDRMMLSPIKISAAGCTWGGSIIKTNILAACGMCLEFADGFGRVVTSAIQQVLVVSGNRKVSEILCT